MIDQTRYKPGQFGWKSPLEDRMAKFEEMRDLIQHNGGWVDSVPADSTIMFSVLDDGSGDALLAYLRKSYAVSEIGVGQKIVPGRYVQHMTLSSSGAFEAAVEGSTKPIARTDRHDAICAVRKFQFGI